MKLPRRRRKRAPETAEPASASPGRPGPAAADFLQHRPARAAGWLGLPS